MTRAETPADSTPGGFVPALLVLSAVAASLTLAWFAVQMPMPTRGTFLYQNVLPRDQRVGLLWSVSTAALVPVLLAVPLRLWRGAGVVEPLRRLSTLLAPLSLAFVVPALFDWKAAQGNPLNYLLVLAAFGLLLRFLLERSLALFAERVPWQIEGIGAVVPRWVYPLGVVMAALGYTAYTSYYTIINHRLIGTTAFDLGIYDNLMFNAMRGNFFHSPVLFGPGDRSYIAGHAEYAMLLFVPFYAIRPGSETMLIIQSATLGFAAVPLYLLGRLYVSRAAAMTLSIAYLVFAPLHGPHFYDFHWLPLGVPFYFWMFYGLATRRTWLACAGAFVLLALREDIAVQLAFFGAFLFFTGLRQRFGLVLGLISSVWFVINKFVIMHLAGAWWFENMYSELFADGKASYGSVITTLVTNPIYSLTTMIRPVKLEYTLHMLASLAFVPLRRAAFVILLIPSALFTVVTTAYPPSTQISFQYTTHWIPFLFLTAILGLALTAREVGGAARRAALLVTLALAVVSHSYNFGALLQQESFTGGFRKISFQMDEKAQTRYRSLMSLVGRIPAEASVAATEALNPHISAREEAYTFRGDFGPAEYVLLTIYEMSSDARKLLNDAFAKHPYGLVAKAGEFYLFKRGLSSAGTESALRELGLKQIKAR